MAVNSLLAKITLLKKPANWTHLTFFMEQNSGKVFASQERVSGFPEKGLTSGEVRETSGEVRGTSGEVWETSGEPLDCCKVPQ